MKAKSIDFSKRGVGDCAMAKGHETYGLFFETNTEIKKLSNAIYKEFKKDFQVKVSCRNEYNNRLYEKGNHREEKCLILDMHSGQ